MKTANHKCDHGDHIVCNECMKPAGDVAQVHLDQAHADDCVDSNYPDERDWYKFENISLYFIHTRDRDKFQEWMAKRDAQIRQDEREKLITQLMVWTHTQTLSREQLQHKGCGNHNGNNECCRNETLELVRSKLNQMKARE